MLVSHSRLRTYKECPLRFDLIYNKGTKQESVRAFEHGREMHRLVDEYGTHCYRQKVGEDEAYAKVLASQTDDPNIQREFMAFVGRMTFDFEGLLGTLETDSGPGLFETWHEMELTDDEKFRCRIDMLHLDKEIGELTLTDWKSGGWSFPMQPDEAPLQLKLYALVMARELGDQVFSVHARIEYLGSGVVWAYDLNDRDWAETEEWLRTQIARVKRETAFLAEPGPHCMNCTVRSACDYGADMRTEEKTTEQIVRELDVLNAKREAYAEALKQRVADEGEYTDGSGRTWGYHEGEQCYEPKDPSKYAEARRDAKLKPWAFCSWSQAALRRDAKRDPLRELLEEKPPERSWGVRFLNEDTNGAAIPMEGGQSCRR